MNINEIKNCFLILILILFINKINSNNNCQSYENNIYQITTNFDNYKPYFILLTLLSNGIFFEETNIQNGQSSAELGIHLNFGTRTGYYQCFNNNTLYLTNFGFIYKNIELDILSNNGVLILQDYYLNFQNNSICIGQLKSSYYSVHTNPFDNNTFPIYIYPIRNLTCELLSGRHYIWPKNEL